ncbi:hypothetical protein CDD81_993 [Ophiocordyceps australis]|uniref:Uncharacterized protein n=1 Tax=Ophiocordyceps australis TaxID=1399860 RepID=A0A2C5XFR4_9HYPO|nr:hypothetical protein CDD81_993 [Ophiocordyceps australis]
MSVYESRRLRLPASDAILAKQDDFEPVFIDVFIHAILASSKTLSLVQNTFFLEQEFRKSTYELRQRGMQFVVKSVQVIVQPEWAAGRDNAGMRETLYQGDNRDVNFYILLTKHLSPNPEQIRPLDPYINTYCSPPFDSLAWKRVSYGERNQDGCIYMPFVKSANTDFASIALTHWLGLCLEDACDKRLDEYSNGEIHHKLAMSRFVPTSRELTKPITLIRVHKKQQNICQSMPCYRELEHLLEDNLGIYCQFYQQTASLKRNAGVYFRNATFPFVPSCGTFSRSGWRILFKDYLNVCNCVVNYHSAPPMTRTMDIFADADDQLPIYIDVFIHAISASRYGPMAKKFYNESGLENEFAQVARFYQEANIIFRLKSIDLTINSVWAKGNDSANMRQSLYAGGTRDLNLYYLEAPSLEHAISTVNATLVFCTFPFSSWWAYLSANEPEHDGCLVSMNSTPGLLATAMQYWIGVHMPVLRLCKEPQCGPKFDSIETAMMRRLLALNRFVPLTTKWARLRLLASKGI